jgi:glutathione S-transferase
MLTIYGVPISVHVRKTLVTANLKGIEHTIDPVIPFNPPPNWNALSPAGLIPAMQDGDITLAESTAICFYLERKKDGPAVLPAIPTPAVACCSSTAMPVMSSAA